MQRVLSFVCDKNVNGPTHSSCPSWCVDRKSLTESPQTKSKSSLLGGRVNSSEKTTHVITWRESSGRLGTTGSWQTWMFSFLDLFMLSTLDSKLMSRIHRERRRDEIPSIVFHPERNSGAACVNARHTERERERVAAAGSIHRAVPLGQDRSLYSKSFLLRPRVPRIYCIDWADPLISLYTRKNVGLGFF